MTQIIQNHPSAARHATGGCNDILLPEDGLAIAYVLSCQQDNPMVYVSPQIASLGFSQKAWTGKPDLRLQQIHGEDMARVEQALQRSRDTSENFSCCYRLYDNDKKLHWIRDKASMLCDESGTPLFIIGVMLDITGEKEIEDELNQHRHHLDRNADQELEQQTECTSLPVTQARPPQNPDDIDFWAARVIAVTRDDWYGRTKTMKHTEAATKPAPQPSGCDDPRPHTGSRAGKSFGLGERRNWAEYVTAS